MRREPGMSEVPVQVVSERDREGNDTAMNTSDSGYVSVPVSASANDVFARIQVSTLQPSVYHAGALMLLLVLLRF